MHTYLADLIDADNHGRLLETSRDFTPFQAICKDRTKHLGRFELNPPHQMAGPNI